jgi:hypothetical protein
MEKTYKLSIFGVDYFSLAYTFLYGNKALWHLYFVEEVTTMILEIGKVWLEQSGVDNHEPNKNVIKWSYKN